MVEIPLERMDKIAVGARMIFTGYDVERRMKMNFAIARYSKAVRLLSYKKTRQIQAPIFV
jgi:hypothetical protein